MSTVPPTASKPSVAASGMEHDALPPGTRFGEFEILRVIGVGGFGIVYLAQDHSLEREVALKEYMPASLAARGQGPQITVRSSSFAETYAIGLRSFVNEARLLARFDHPSLVKVYRFWEDNATAYMVMPFLQGVTLRDTRRGMAHPPDEAWIRSVITPILSALELLHREGVYHRDIAPDNILLSHDGPPVLLDFGAARRVISDRTQSLTAILKPSYAPIEQYAEMAQMRQGPWTDLYALGAVIHYLLFGAPPAPATARAVQDDADLIENRIVPGVSPRLLEAVSWMLSIRPNQRPQSGEQLRAVLDGHAEIPPRGRPGITIPGAAAPAAPPAAFEPTRHVDHVPDGTPVRTSYVPTHLPTSQMPAADPQATTFKPTASMPTARVPPSQFDAPLQPTTMPPAARTAPPRTTQPPPRRPEAGATQPPPFAASRAGTLPPPLAARGPAGATQPPQARAASTQPPRTHPPRTQPAPLQASATRPAPLAGNAAAAATPAKSSKNGLVVGGAVAIIVLIAAIVGWQWSARKGDAASAAAAASAADAASAPATAAVSPASTPTAPPPMVAVPAPAPSTATMPAVASTAASSPFGAVVAPATVATTVASTPTPTPTPSRAASGARVAAASGVDPKLAASAQASAASNARGRLAGKPVPGVGPDGVTAGGTPVPGRPGETSPYGGASGATGSAAAAAERARLAAAARDAAARPVPAVAEAVPSTAREACGKRVFISLAICMDEQCEQPRFRTSPECIGILARKASRENR